MASVVWTPIAESDLEDILYYISVIARSPVTGEKIYCEIRDRVTELAEKRIQGQRHADALDGWLYVRHKRWLVFYQPLDDGIEVLRVVDGVRDLPLQL